MVSTTGIWAGVATAACALVTLPLFVAERL